MNKQDTLGKTIKRLREGKKLTLQETAQKLEIDFSMLARIEKGERSANEVLFKKLALLFNVEEKLLKTLSLADKIYKDVHQCEFANEALKIVQARITERNK